MHVAGKMELFPGLINYPGEDRATSIVPCPPSNLEGLPLARELLDGAGPFHYGIA